MESVAAVKDAPAGSRFNELETRNHRAAIRRVLPSDDGAGAREAGADDYVLEVMEKRAGPLSVRDAKTGLGMLEDLARRRGERSFCELSAAEQDEVLRQLQLIPHPTVQRFFKRLVALTLEGFLCDPQRGGNRDQVGWSSLGIEGARVPGACVGEDPCPHE